MPSDLNHPPHRNLLTEIVAVARTFIGSGKPTEDQTRVSVDKQSYDRLARLVQETGGVV